GRDPGPGAGGGRRGARAAQGRGDGGGGHRGAGRAAALASPRGPARAGALLRQQEGLAVAVATEASEPGGKGLPGHWDDLGSVVRFLEERGELRRVAREVDPVLEVSEIAQRVMRAGGPALLFERIKGSSYPLLINTYATRRRVSWALGVGDLEEHARD